MVWSFKRRNGVEPAIGIECSVQGLQGAGFHRLVRGKRRQQARQTAGEHCLSRPRRPAHQQVVPAGCGDFESPPGIVLTLHVRKVPRPLRLGRAPTAQLHWHEVYGADVPAEDSHSVGQAYAPAHIDIACQSGFAFIGLGHNHSAQAFPLKR